MQCLKSAMRDVGKESRLANRADLRKEYVKLFSVASNNAQVCPALIRHSLRMGRRGAEGRD
jgi:hypothetical protein